MRPVIAIFRKDARRLWPQIAVFWVMLALGVLWDPGRADIGTWQHGALFLFLSVAKPLACWTLLVAAIHEERLPGDRQYWLTRPFTWGTLLAEKVLFAACFINLAVFVSQVAVLERAGIPPLSHLPALLWKQVFFTAAFLLPVAALAAVTRSLGQVILAAFLVLGPFLALQQIRNTGWLNLEWVHAVFGTAVVIAGVAAVLFLQYSARRTKISRVLIGVTVVCDILLTGFLPPAWVNSLRARLSGAGEARVEVTLLDPSHRIPNPYSGTSGTVTFELPIHLDGIPAGATFLPERFDARIRMPRSSPIPALPNRFLVVAPAQGQLSLYVSSGVYDFIKDQPVDLGGLMEFALVRGGETLPVPGKAGDVVSGIGVCFPVVSQFLTGPPRLNIGCSTPFPRFGVYLAGEIGRPNWIIPPGSARDPIPTDNGFEILERYTSQISYADETELRGVRLHTAQPVAHAQLAYSFHDIRLADYLH